MHSAARQAAVSRRGGYVVLVGQFAQNQATLLRREVRQHHRHGFIPPAQGPQIGLLARVVEPGQVHACQHLAHLRAVGRRGGQLVVAAQLVDHGGRLAFQAVQDVALGVRGRVGHRNAALCQVFHQVQVIRQLLEGQALKQRQHILAALGVYKVIGVFNAACRTFDALQWAQIQAVQKRSRLVKRDFGIDGHA